MATFVVRLLTVVALMLPFSNVHAADKNIESRIGGKTIAISVPRDSE